MRKEGPHPEVSNASHTFNAKAVGSLSEFRQRSMKCALSTMERLVELEVVTRLLISHSAKSGRH